MAREGVSVVQLYERSAAERAGLRLDDRVVAVDSEEIASLGNLRKMAQWLTKKKPALTARRFTIVRDGMRRGIDLPDRRT
tara:strand:+ start:3162 stop:3401 length:240 start_codon:yes stop_codon:yes gene_type:complete